MASPTPLVDALREVLKRDESGSSYVCQEYGSITIDGWWDTDTLEEALRDVFKSKEN